MSLDYTKFDTDIKHPVVPCLIPLPKYMEANLGFRIKGIFKSTGKQFSIALLQEDGSTSPLTITIRYDGWVLRTNYTDKQGYGPTEDDGRHPFKQGAPFDVLLICREGHFEIFLNNKFFTTFKHRSSYSSILDMEIYGDITLQLISFHHYNEISNLTVDAPPPPPDSQRPKTDPHIPLTARSASKTGMRNVAPPPVSGSEPPPLGNQSGASLGIVSYGKTDAPRVVMPQQTARQPTTSTPQHQDQGQTQQMRRPTTQHGKEKSGCCSML